MARRKRYAGTGWRAGIYSNCCSQAGDIPEKSFQSLQFGGHADNGSNPIESLAFIRHGQVAVPAADSCTQIDPRATEDQL